MEPRTSKSKKTEAAGQGSATFYLQGVEGQSGTAALTASAPGYTDSPPATVTVTPVALALTGVPSSTTTLAADSLFQVQLGALNAAGTGFYAEQAIRVGGSAVTATVSLVNSSPAGVGQLTTTAGSGSSRTVTIAVGQARSPDTVPSGGVAFDPLLAGTVDIQATAPGVVSLPAATQGVTVNP